MDYLLFLSINFLGILAKTITEKNLFRKQKSLFELMIYIIEKQNLVMLVCSLGC